MDKETKPILDAMINTEFRKGMREYFATVVTELLGEMYDNTKVANHENKDDVFAKYVMMHNAVKNELIKVLDDSKLRMTDLVERFLKNYTWLNCSKDSAEITYYHDRASIYFLEELERAQKIIKAGEYRKFWRTLLL